MTKKDNPLRLRRLAAGLSQTELARRAGMHRSSLVFIEEGTTRHPAEETLQALSVWLQVSERTLREELEAWLARQEPAWTAKQRKILALTAHQLTQRYPSFVAWRKDLGLSQPRLATVLGISRSTILEYESGVRTSGMPDSLLSGLLRLGLPSDVVLALSELPPAD